MRPSKKRMAAARRTIKRLQAKNGLTQRQFEQGLRAIKTLVDGGERWAYVNGRKRP